MLDAIVGQSTDPGKLRANNEDAMGSFIPNTPAEARSHGWMFVVADGAGGLDYGNVASTQTVALLEKGFAEAAAKSPLPEVLADLIQRANKAVYDEAVQPEREGKPMATTVVACAVRFDQAVVAHVGNSRCYHLRDGKVLSVTQDHTFANEQQRLGLITASEAASSETRNTLTRLIGTEPAVTVETVTFSVAAGDALLLCSDGLHSGIYDEDIVRIISGIKDPQKAAEDLVRYAVEVDGSDNATAQVIRVLEVESAPE